MTPSDGLGELLDGSGSAGDAPPQLEPLSEDNLPAERRLWVVREKDVVHAQEHCEFGKQRPAGRLKHTNLTGGEPAYSGGELLIVDNNRIIVSGDSGRYGPRSAAEMQDVSIAFRDAGYTVYSLGYDQEANRAFPLVGPSPRLT
jgi:hypothetical protein